jgi:hypothetical protein
MLVHACHMLPQALISVQQASSRPSDLLTSQPAQPYAKCCTLVLLSAIQKISQKETNHPMLAQFSFTSSSAIRELSSSGGVLSVDLQQQAKQGGRERQSRQHGSPESWATPACLHH